MNPPYRVGVGKVSLSYALEFKKCRRKLKQTVIFRISYVKKNIKKRNNVN